MRAALLRFPVLETIPIMWQLESFEVENEAGGVVFQPSITVIEVQESG